MTERVLLCFGCWVFIVMSGLSLVSSSRGYFLVAMHGPLVVVASLVMEHRTLGPVGLVVVTHGLSCSMACGIFRDQGSNLCPLHWQADS